MSRTLDIASAPLVMAAGIVLLLGGNPWGQGLIFMALGMILNRE
jgi:hypothetical protein